LLVRARSLPLTGRPPLPLSGLVAIRSFCPVENSACCVRKRLGIVGFEMEQIVLWRGRLMQKQ
ncbi:MAG: hypothetical protein ACK2VA_17545, partial [Anaerolineae bacterium]